MKPLDINFTSDGDAFYPTLQPRDWAGASLEISTPVECCYLDGSSTTLAYAGVENEAGGAFLGSRTWTHGGSSFSIADRWQAIDANRVRLRRRLRVESQDKSAVSQVASGCQLHLELRVATEREGWRFFAPAMLYSPDQRAGERLVTFNDDRLAYPLVAAYHPATGRGVCLSRVSLAAFDNPPLRPSRERRYIQRTDVGSTGFSREDDATALHLFWPYYEGEKSALLDAAGSDASAFYPLDGATLDLSFEYEVFAFEAETFAIAVLAAFKNAYAMSNVEPPRLPFSLEDSVSYRLASLRKTYTEWHAGAGFVLNFDPERGYDSQAKAFGASFTTHDTNESHSILEYGFTGRQLNAAYVLAEEAGGEWMERGVRLVDFFVEQLATPSGWLYTMYHLDKQRPLYTVGDPDGPIMHYLAISEEPGNYTRMMVEAATDLLLNYKLHKQQGTEHEPWRAACLRFADFLVRCQNADGSWYRAYTPDGRPVRSGAWFGATEAEGKSATAIPVPYLLAISEEAGHKGEVYKAAARKACDYVLREHVAFDVYRGGTLDNPNVVDKEAAMLAMSALLSMYEKTREETYLRGAERAASLAITWNSIWNVPLMPGTRLYEVGVQSTGWGGINSIWGAGATDIYSLFCLAEFERLSRLMGERIYADVALLVAHGTQQVLSHPGDLMGFADIGMQPEGISFCNQGVDDGLIAKGDIWGGLGWIYTAGTFGLGRYLREREVIGGKHRG